MFILHDLCSKHCKQLWAECKDKEINKKIDSALGEPAEQVHDQSNSKTKAGLLLFE